MACLALLALVIGSYFLGIEMQPVGWNLAWGIAAFFAYCVLAAACWFLRPRIAGVALGLIASLPILCGYALGTVGALGLVFILGDYLAPPVVATRLRPGLSCEIQRWGYAFSDGGYTVRVYRYPTWLPLVRQEVREVTVNETRPQNGVVAATCRGVAAI